MSWKEHLTKLYDFAVICVATLAVIGGTAYLFHDGRTLFGFANIGLVAMAMPYIISRVKDIMSVDDEEGSH